MSKKSLGDRMKSYEQVCAPRLMIKTPVIVRIDGRAFHTYCKPLESPWDQRMIDAMTFATIKLLEDIGGNAVFAYLQSDECNIFLIDDATYETQPWFDNKLEKISSIMASIFTVFFNQKMLELDGPKRPAFFDSRVFNVPYHEVNNYFIWRQQDSIRNSIYSWARTKFSYNQLHSKNKKEMLWMMRGADASWEDCVPAHRKYGWAVHRRATEFTIPKGSKEGEVISRLMFREDLTPPDFKEDRLWIQSLSEGHPETVL